MLIHTKGILLKTNVYGSTSLICQLLTVEHGLVSLMMKGVRTKQQRNTLALLQPTAILSVIYHQKPSRQIHHVNSIQSEVSFLHILSSPHKVSILFILQELLWKVHKYHPLEQPELDFHQSSLEELSHNFSNQFLVNWLVNLIQTLHLEPELVPPNTDVSFSLEQAEWQTNPYGVNQSIMANWQALAMPGNAKKSLEGKERHQLIEILIAYLQAQIPEFGQIKSLSIIQSLYRPS